MSQCKGRIFMMVPPSNHKFHRNKKICFIPQNRILMKFSKVGAVNSGDIRGFQMQEKMKSTTPRRVHGHIFLPLV